MASPRISLLKSEAVGSLPTASAMASGELAVNYADKKIYGKHPGSGAVVQVAASPIHTHAVADVTNAVGSVTTGIANATPITNMMQITLAGYNALGVNVAPNTLYIIVG